MKRMSRTFLFLVLALLVAGCKPEKSIPVSPSTQMAPEAYPGEPAKWRVLRENMVANQIERRGVHDPKVIAAMRKVPRQLFVPESFREDSYDDNPLPIGSDQTISQPYIVAKMTELMNLKGGESVLEIGTGSGYQAAVLAEIALVVYTIEIIPELGLSAEKRLKEIGYKNILVRVGDGYKGWPEFAPFDSIIVTAAPPFVQQPLKDQIRVGGRLVLPVGETFQELIVVTRTQTGYDTVKSLPVRFVPMTGEVQNKIPESP